MSACCAFRSQAQRCRHFSKYEGTALFQSKKEHQLIVYISHCILLLHHLFFGFYWASHRRRARCSSRQTDAGIAHNFILTATPFFSTNIFSNIVSDASTMNFSGTAFCFALRVACACAISCNVGSFGTGQPNMCIQRDQSGGGTVMDTCWTCKGSTVTTYNTCSSTISTAGSGCTALRAEMCPSPGVWTTCTQANCNTCSPSSVLAAASRGLCFPHCCCSGYSALRV